MKILVIEDGNYDLEKEKGVTMVRTYKSFEQKLLEEYDFFIVDGTFPLNLGEKEDKEIAEKLYDFLKEKKIVDEEMYSIENYQKDFRAENCVYKPESSFIEWSPPERPYLYAGALVIRKLSEFQKKYILFTSDSSHGRFSIYCGLMMGGVLDINYLKNNYMYQYQTLVTDQIIKPRAVVFGGDKKPYSQIISKIKSLAIS